MEITLPRLHKHQREVALDKHRFKVLACGRRWGKTMLCAEIALKYFLEGKQVWWIAPTYSIAGIGWTMIKTMLHYIPLPVEVHEADRKLVLQLDKKQKPAFLAFKSAERPENLRGESLSYAIFDEADFIDQSVWFDSIRPALADQKGGAIFISTPFIENGWFHTLWKQGQDGDRDIRSWTFSSYTNPFLDSKEIDSAKEEVSSLTFKREFMAEFVGAAGARVKREWLKYFDKVPERLDIVLGVDLAISTKQEADYTAVCVLGRAKDGIVYVLAQERMRGSFGEQQIFIKQLSEKWKPRLVAVEQVAYQAVMIQQLQATTKLAVRGFKTNKDKVTRFAPLEARFEHGQVFLSRDLPGYFENELLEFPVSLHDDCVDSMSIAWEALGQTVVAPIVSATFEVRNDTDWRR
jgi:predicted phage terminase large subunit-like protein